MKLSRRWLAIAGAVVLTAALGAGAAMAFGGGDPAAQTERLKAAVDAGKITQAQTDVMAKLGELRQAAHAKLQADEQAIVDQAVKDGKLTQEQADNLRRPKMGMHGKGPRGGPGMGKMGPGMGGMGPGFGHKWGAASPEQLKSKLDAAVKAGKLTQEQADKILERMSQRKAPAKAPGTKQS